MPLPETEMPGALQHVLSSRGIRMTRQRRVILGIIESSSRHLDAAQILRKTVRVDPNIDRVTVYRTLSLLKRHGLIDEPDLLHAKGDGRFYERRPERKHMHMTCLGCGKVLEFESESFDRIQGQVQRDCHFHIVVAHFEMGGYCVECQNYSRGDRRFVRCPDGARKPVASRHRSGPSAFGAIRRLSGPAEE